MVMMLKPMIGEQAVPHPDLLARYRSLQWTILIAFPTSSHGYLSEGRAAGACGGTADAYGGCGSFSRKGWAHSGLLGDATNVPVVQCKHEMKFSDHHSMLTTDATR